MVEKYLEVIQNIFPLLSTIEEGFYHVKKQLSELRYEEAFILLQDIMIGIASVESAIESMKSELPESDIAIFAEILKRTMSNIVSSYEQKREINLEKQVGEDILPVFKMWKRELEKTLKPYIIS